MKEVEMRTLIDGDIVRHRGSGQAYIIIANYAGRPIAVRTIELSNPSEWELAAKVKHESVESDRSPRIEQYPEFLCTVDENPVTEENYRMVWKVTAVAIPWKDSEYVPASVAEASSPENYPFPVKILKRPKDWISSRTVLAIRTDVYPLLWVYVWLYLQVENLVYIAWCEFMWGCNCIGLARTKPGFMYSWRDLFWWIRKPQVTIPVTLPLPVTSPTETTEEDIFVYDCVGNLIPAFPSYKQSQLDCIGCKYFYGSSDMVCAVHPRGYEGSNCVDREAKITGSDR